MGEPPHSQWTQRSASPQEPARVSPLPVVVCLQPGRYGLLPVDAVRVAVEAPRVGQYQVFHPVRVGSGVARSDEPSEAVAEQYEVVQRHRLPPLLQHGHVHAFDLQHGDI